MMKKFEDIPQYQGQVAPASSAFPFGAPIDNTVAGLGTPYTAETEKVHQALIQRLFAVAGVDPNGQSDTAQSSQLYDVMQAVLNDFSRASNREAVHLISDPLPEIGMGSASVQFALSLLRSAARVTAQTSTSDTGAGRALLNGAHGLGGSPILTANADAITASGFYRGSISAIGAGTFAIVAMSSPAVQFAISESTGDAFFRSKVSGSWRIWRNLIDDQSGAGKVEWFATNTTPAGYLRPNGAAVNRSLYGGLYAVIGTTFGNGNGTTTFNIPDLRGRFLRAYDDGAGVDPGRAFGSTQEDEFKSHSHTLPVRDNNNTGNNYIEDADSTQLVRTANTGNTGGTETRPKNIALMPYIKF